LAGLRRYTCSDKKLLFARPPVLSAALVRENWFSGSPSMARPYQAQAQATTVFTRQFLPGLGANCAKSFVTREADFGDPFDKALALLLGRPI